MAGALDSLFKNVAKQVVADLGKSFDHTITYTRKASPSYNTSTGALTTTDTAYSFDAPVEFVDSEEEEGREERKAKLYITNCNLRSGVNIAFQPDTMCQSNRQSVLSDSYR